MIEQRLGPLTFRQRLFWMFAFAIVIFVMLPGVVDVILLIPAAVWDKMMRARVASATYQRS
jgi:heme/copper-type cytochrome/quinol oxidase subunit 1